MSIWRDLYRGDNRFDFPRLWKRAATVSAALVLISVGALFIRGLNLSIEFVGGTSWELSAPDLSVADARSTFTSISSSASTIQTVGGDTIRIRSSIEDPETVAQIQAALADSAGIKSNDVSVTTVGPSWGKRITSKARSALVWFFLIVAAYISIRLEWKMAVGALVAVAHDIGISIGLYALFQFDVTPATVIAFLTIMGYSLYDTIVVYDKVRDNTARLAGTGRYTYTEMMNLSLNQVLMRSINTSITSVMPVLSMLVIGSVFFGAPTLQEFAIALAIGIFIGSYSSIFLATYIVALMKEREPEFRAIRTRVEARHQPGTATRAVSDDDRAALTGRSAVGAGAVGGGSAGSRSRPSQAGRPGGTPPRPRKKKKKR